MQIEKSLNNKLMNLLFKPIWAACCALTLVLGSCQKVAIDGNEDGGKESKTGEKVTLTVNVNQIELVPFGDISAAKQTFSDVTRTTNVAEACHHLCFALYKDGKRVKYANQNVGSENFGTVALRVEPGRYKLLVLAHNAEKNPATTDPERIAFGKDVTDTFYDFEEINVENAGTVNVSLRRAVAKFQLVMTDVVPEGFSQVYCFYTGGGTTFDAVKGVGVTVNSQYKSFGLSGSDVGKSKTFEIYTFPKSEKDTLNMTVETFKTDDEIQRKITFRVPVRRNMISRYSGSLFDETANASFHISMTSPDEWITEEHSF